MDELLLVVNAGSSSLKLSLVVADEHVTVHAATIDAWDGTDLTGIGTFVRGHHVGAVAHRVVHGGTSFTGPVVLDREVEAALAALTSLAPLHQGPALAGIAASRRVVPDAVQTACFDTAFHASIPAEAATYAVPVAWRERWGVRRFGFHGLSHRWASRRAAELLGRPLEDLALVTCHLGAGASLCAVHRGTSVDTTMGFTPLEGLVMATRSGSVDPGLLVWLLRQGLPLDELEAGLEHQGGLLALCGTGDMRRLLLDRERRRGPEGPAFDVYVHRLCREVAAMTAALGRLDALVFTGGVGEHAPLVRSSVVARLAFLGLRLDAEANAAATTDALVSPPDATAATVVVTAREDLEIARQVGPLLAGRDSSRPSGAHPPQPS